MNNTALLALSSPGGSDNYYSQLINLKDEVTGEPFFNLVDCVQICESCRKLEREEQLKCTHIKQGAHWLSKRKNERIKALYKTDPGTGLRELVGVIEDDYAPCFLKDEIAQCFERHIPVSTYTPDMIYVAVDPSGGGPSHLAIVSGYYDGDNNFVIIGMDSILVKTKMQIKNALTGHFEAINRIGRFKTAMKIFIPENNLGNEATHMNSMIKNRPDVRTYWQKDDRPGVNKSAPVTDHYQFLLNTKLHENSLLFDFDAFTISKGMTLKSIRMLLREQMERYHYEFDQEKNKVHITGKQGGDKQDDLLIATMMAVYWGRACRKDPKRLM